MGKVDTDTDTPSEHQFEDINLDDFSDNKSGKASSGGSPPSTSSSLGRKKYSFHHSKNGIKNKIEPQQNNGVYKAKEFDTPIEDNNSNSSGNENEFGESLLPEAQPVPFYKLFRFASVKDKILLFFGVLTAMIAGCTMPVMIILFGQLTNSFVINDLNQTAIIQSVCETYPQCCQNQSKLHLNKTDCDLLVENVSHFANTNPNESFFDQITKFGLGTVTIGAINLVMAYIFVTCLNHAAECQVHRIRGLFFKSVLRQDIGWYDTHQTGDFAVKMAEDLNKIQEGIGEKIGMFIFFMTICICSISNAFYHGWELTLVMIAAMPLLMIAVAIIAGSQTALTEKEANAYGRAGAIADEVLSSIRTVVAFGGQEKEVERYESKLIYAKKAGLLRGILTGVGGGFMWLIIYSSYALAFWYGVKLIMDDREKCFDSVFEDCDVRYDASSLLVVFFSVLLGAMNVGQATPYVEAFSMAKGAASTIFAVIDRKPPIDSLSESGQRPEGPERNIRFEDVIFKYPARPDIPILQGLTLEINQGETVALVGPSGCGKSTCVQLIQRFYDPEVGKVQIGGHDIKDLNVSWLRERIGVVGQEPVLFGCTIAENIRYGRDDITDEEMEKACREANAYNFIVKLPKKFETLVGERGAQLSGGQKQRLAIARALVRNPEILLLDEATSALDTQSESVVQAALDKARTGRTTIIVAHRLSTIRTADKIVAIKDGIVQEVGTHDQLMERHGLYHSLVVATLSNEEEDEKEDVVDELEVVDYSLPSLASMTNYSLHTWQGRKNSKKTVERKISVSSIMSDDSFSMDHLEEAGAAIGAVVGISKVSSSLRESRRRKSLSRQDSAINPEPDDDDLPKVDTLRIVKTNAPEWPFLLMGGLGSIVMGASMPIYAFLFAEVLGLLSDPVDTARTEIIFYSLMFLLLGVAVGLAMLIQIAMFTVAGENLTLRMRKLAFAAMLKQEMGWFDQPNNNTGALCSRLSADASAIQGVTGNRLGAILQSVFTIVLAVCGGIYYEWRLGLAGASYVPMLLLSSTFHAKIIASHDNIEKEALARSAKLAIEAITNIRTVAGLGREKTFVRRYIQELEKPHQEAKKKSHIRGLVFGFAQSMPFFAYAGTMYYGGYLVDKKELEYQNVYKVAEALILGTIMVGQATAFAPNYNKAVLAAARVFRLLDRRPLIDSQGQSGVRLNRLDGNVSFKKANFRYPTRPQVRVLRDLDLDLSAGKRVALVGPSGCGKSTCIQLLQRFYDLKNGELTLDELNIEGLNVPHTRSQIGIVSQEPTLFDRTIAENIKYGDNSRVVTMDEVVEAAKMANIHSFIAALPQGYDTRVGEKGTQLSGGQKQRVAIARALIRNPSILLLDEATSALDTESEKVVQEALDKAQEGRTSITIAHRLSTVQNVDKIYVISHGRVTEAGTHTQLLAQRGLYAKLWSKQAGTH